MVWAHTVHVRTSTSSTMRATVAVCVTASGKMLPPVVIFKGKKGGRIKREFTRYNPGAFYAVQEKAWMDEKVMQFWIDKILKPYLQTAPQGVRPLLLLDSYRCHHMKSILENLSDAGTQTKHIPGGCTGFCQPIDVGVTKPLKDRVRHSWEDWIMAQGITTRKLNPPSRETLANWIVTSLQSLNERLIKNSWCHGKYSYFPFEGMEDHPRMENSDTVPNENVTDTNIGFVTVSV